MFAVPRQHAACPGNRAAHARDPHPGDRRRGTRIGKIAFAFGKSRHRCRAGASLLRSGAVDTRMLGIRARRSRISLGAERAFQVFIDVLLAASRRRPILGIVEDIQWIDPTTIELLVRVIAHCSGERIMVLITHRDDYRAEWLSSPEIRRIALQKLPIHECEQMVAAVAGSDFVPRRITSQIVERTDGVPLFVEEFTRTVVDSGAISLTAESPVPSGKLPEPLVPASIHDSLMERLDRLGPAKRVAQIASVFGRRFNYEGIFSVFPGKGQTLKHALRALG